jgi:hypothetical protein
MVLILAVQESHNDWIPIGISLLALVGTLGNYLLTLSRGRKHVQIKSWVNDSTAVGGTVTYRCRVTNTGYIGVQIESVSVTPRSGGFSIGLRLQEGAEPRKLDQGESQEWETELDFLLEPFLKDPDMLQVNIEREETESAGVKVSIEGLETKVVTVAEDTAGEKYVQKQKDALPFRNFLQVAYESEAGYKSASPWNTKSPEDWIPWIEWLRACADRLATFHTCRFSERLSGLFITH